HLLQSPLLPASAPAATYAVNASSNMQVADYGPPKKTCTTRLTSARCWRGGWRPRRLLRAPEPPGSFRVLDRRPMIRYRRTEAESDQLKVGSDHTPSTARRSLRVRVGTRTRTPGHLGGLRRQEQGAGVPE